MGINGIEYKVLKEKLGEIFKHFFGSHEFYTMNYFKRT